MTRAKRWWLLVIALELVVFLTHALLLRWFAEGEVAGVLFTGGHDVSLVTLVGACLFFLVRLTLYLALPGVVLAQLGCLILALGRTQRSPQPQ